MSDEPSRAERLRSQRSKVSETAEQVEQAESSESSKPSKPSKPAETDETDEPSVKDEQVGTYMYLPEGMKRDVNRYYKKLAGDYEFEFGEELEKNRHWYPLVVTFGLEELKDAEPEEIQEMLADAEIV